MVVLNRIYTRTGDDGRTGLATGERVTKFSPRVEAYGAVDEANSALGLALLHCPAEGEVFAILRRLQNDLFDLGADLATPEPRMEADGKPAWTPLRILPSQVERLESEIDVLNARLSPLTSFVLPGGSAASAHLHVARAILRRAERKIAELAADPAEAINPAALHYANRGSDLLFVAARVMNDDGAADVLWVPGAGR